MGQGEPNHKGVGLIAVVKGIKSNPRAEAKVPASLAHYLNDPVLLSAWYPERDYNALLALLAASIDAKAVGGDVWAFLGRVAAQRDIGGEQDNIPRRSRTESAGIYRKFRDVDVDDIAGLFLRASKVWTLYHDTGRVVYARHPERPDVVVERLVDFHFPLRGMADLQTAYMVELARLSGIELEGSLLRYSSDPSVGCEWTFRVPNDPEKLRSIERLPAAVRPGG